MDNNPFRCSRVIRPIQGHPYMCPSPVRRDSLCSDHLKLLAKKLENNGEPQEFKIPKGYKSGFMVLEIDLNDLWMGEKKFLRQFHKPLEKKSFRASVEDIHTGGSFNSELN